MDDIRNMCVKKLYAIALIVVAFGTSQAALATVSNVTGSADAATKEAAVKKAQENLNASCKSFGGTPVADSFKITFEKPLSNGKFYVDATMQCDVP